MKAYRNTITGQLRQTFNGMNRRCNDPAHKSFKNYGGRGIQNRFESSDEFVDYVLLDLCGDPRGLQIDRIDNDGHYERGNIRFVTREVNNNNKRNTGNKKFDQVDSTLT